MQAGRLDRLITIETVTIGKDAQGGATKTWAALAEVWAEKITLAGTERLLAAQITVQAQVKYRMRYRPDFDETARIVDDGVNYDIVQIAEVKRRQGLDVLVKRSAVQ